MTPFHRAREAARALRQDHLGSQATTAIASTTLIAAIAHEDAEDFEISPAEPSDATLGGADALLIRKLRQIVVRNDVSNDQRAFLVAHEFGHWKLHPEDHDSCHKVIDGNLDPASEDTFGARKVEAYGARERSELQANLFARELLLPRAVARTEFLAGKTARQLANDLVLPLELVRQQLLDGLLLPEPQPVIQKPREPITPTPEQEAAATSSADVSLVVAGPGTGKTATLMLRIQHLLSKGVKPSEILVLTFSNRAARELMDRLQDLGVEGANDMWVGTFHAFGLEFLRKNHEHFGLNSQFGVADKMAQIAVLEPHIYGLGLTAFNPLGDPLDWLNGVVNTIQRGKDELADAKAFAKAVEKSAADTDERSLAKQRDIAKLYQCYETQIRQKGSLVDMGDLVMLPAIALSKDYAKYTASVSRFQHVLVDEYQDVNRASAQLVKAIAKHARTLWVVGDARQAIYRFRGASMRNIVHFKDDYPKHQVFPLNENRRSYEEVVRVFEHTGREANPLQMVLPLNAVETIRGSSGVKPRHIQCADEEVADGELVANVKRIHDAGVPYRDQVVLASQHDACGAAARALNAVGVPALHLGDIFQRPEIKDLLALLQLFIDHSGAGLLRVSKLAGPGIPAADVDVLLAWHKANRPRPLSWLKSPPPGISTAGTAAIRQWSETFKDLDSSDSPWEVICSLLLDRAQILRPYLTGNGILDITRRLALWQFIYYLRVPDGGVAYQTVGSFITRLRRRLRVGDDRELRIPPPEADSLDAVGVMTIHGSKGLEFEAVHLVDIDARHFRVSSDPELVPRSLLKSIAPRDNFEEETEASNKLYVALSRAREHLVLYESQGRYNAECVEAVSQAGHLFLRVRGTSKSAKVSLPPPASLTTPTPDKYPLPGLLTYRVCPRRYYYDYVKGLTPAAGLHPAALIEGAVMRDLFVPYGQDVSLQPKEVEAVLASLGPAYIDSTRHLRAYADQLLKAGRDWLGQPRAAMGKPQVVSCAGLPLEVVPHRVTKSDDGSVITLEFVRVKPPGKLARQHKALKWVLRYLAQQYPKHSFTGSIFVLGTAQAESVSPNTWLRNDFFEGIAKRLIAGDFDAKPSVWECPKCRHFMHCAA